MVDLERIWKSIMFQNRRSRPRQCTRDDRLHLQPRAFYLHLKKRRRVLTGGAHMYIVYQLIIHICWQADIDVV